MSEVWHRVELVHYAAPVDEFDRPSGRGTVDLIHHTYRVIKRTARGVWIDVGGFIGGNGKRFVLVDSKRQFASPTFEQAKDKFALRKRRQIEILREQVRDIEIALSKLEKFQPRELVTS